ncbi:hypothetical protein LZ554_005974 [Drepanopeziza brunnea f. sp. 'monogermtubi']|nr:hypothetical protein LZ554_005974 [Drepanopeziza brunnea f. sp. 'monogermtubi']
MDYPEIRSRGTQISRPFSSEIIQSYICSSVIFALKLYHEYCFGPPSASTHATEEKHADPQHVVHVATHDRVPGHENYYEKNGLRTYGDGEDHDHEPPMSPKRMMSLIAMSFIWTGSQIPVYIFGAIPLYIHADIGGADRWIWFVFANLLALAGVCPFVGSLSDFFGRRYICLFGFFLVILGMFLLSTAKVMNTFIAGMAIAGVGAGISELTAFAATSELALIAKRGKYVAVLIFTILPFWGFLSLSGMILFMAGMQWGGYQYDWDSAHVLAPLILGFLFLAAFVLWEIYGTEHPMFPSRLKQAPRILALTLVITFISGANFFSIIMFWPTQAFNVYGHDPVGVGIRGDPVGFSILAGAVIVLWCLSVLRGGNRELIVISSVMMTAGCGALACADRFNLHQLWAILVLAGLGIGGIVVPASIITTIICPDDLIATITALTLAIRVIGGSIGHCVYYNVFINKFVPNAKHYIGGTMALQLGITNLTDIRHAIEYTGASLLPLLHTIPGIGMNETRYEMVVLAGQIAFAESYKYVYYTSIAFGAVSIVAACFLGDVSPYMDDHVAVVMH